MVTLYVTNSHIFQWGYLELNNPTLTLNIEERSLKEPSTLKIPYTYSFDVPATENNTKLLGTPNSPFTYNHSRIPAILSITNPSITYTGYIIVDSCTEKNYTINFYGTLGEVFHSLNTNRNGDKATLYDILPSTLKDKYFTLTPENVMQSMSGYKLGFHSSDGTFILDAILAQYGYDTQDESLAGTAITDTIDLSKYNTTYNWPLNSIAGKYLPYQFGDFRVECLQPVLSYNKYFTWLTNYLSSTYEVDLIFPDYSTSEEFGVALPLFTSFKDDDISTGQYLFTSTRSTIKSFGDAYIDIQLSLRSYDTDRQLGYVFTGDDTNHSTIVVAFSDYNDGSLRGRYPDATIYYFSPTTSPVTGSSYGIIRIPIKGGVTYTLSQFYQTFHDGYEDEFTALTPTGLTYYTLNDTTYELTPYDITAVSGYYNGSSWITNFTVPRDSKLSGSIMSLKDYFSKSETPLFYLIEYCKVFNYVIEFATTYNNVQGKYIIISKAYKDSATTTETSPFLHYEVESISPQVFTETSILFKYASNSDWFSKQYNNLYPSTPLGSGVQKLDHNPITSYITVSDVASSDDYKEFISTNLKYPASSTNSIDIYRVGTTSYPPTSEITVIAYDNSGKQVDLSGSLFRYATINIDVDASRNLGISMNRNNEPSVLDYSASSSSTYARRVPLGSSTVRLVTPTVVVNGNDLVTFGEAKYFPSNSGVPNIISSIPALCMDTISSYFSDAIYLTKHGFAAKKIKFKATYTSDIKLFHNYVIENLGIVVPIKVSIGVGKARPVATVEALLYTSEYISKITPNSPQS